MIELLVKDNKITLVAAQGEGYTKGFEAGKEEGIKEGKVIGVEEGREAQNKEFWEDFLRDYGNYQQAFAGHRWQDSTYNPTKPIIATVSAEDMFRNNTQITSTKVPIEIRGCSANYMLCNATRLVTVPYIGFFGATGNSTFASGCGALENITFDGEITLGIGFASCPKLTKETVNSLIAHLGDLTGKTPQKLTFHAAVGAKLTQEQKDYITKTLNWVLAY